MGRYDKIQALVHDPKYVAPRLPTVREGSDTQANEEILNTLRRNSEAEDGEYLHGLSATLAFRKPYKVLGNINPNDTQPSPYRNKVRSWYNNHPYEWEDLVRIPYDKESDTSAHELINRDLSNYRHSDYVLTKKGYNDFLKKRISLLGAESVPNDHEYKYPSVATTKRAGQYVADYNRLRNAFKDWRGALKGDSYLDSFYDKFNLPGTDYDDWSRSEDARKMSKALAVCNGDVEKAWALVVSEDPEYAITPGAYDAISNMVGYDEALDDEYDYQGFRGKTIERFFNAYNAALQNYDVDDSRPSYTPYYGYSQDDYDTHMKQQAARDIVLRPNGQNQYARGGHLRTPNTIRSRNGLKMRRADDLGSADYDIYF